MDRSTRLSLLWILFLLLGRTSLYAVDCSDLKAPEKIKVFFEKAKTSNFFTRKQASLYLTVSACEKEMCDPQHQEQRSQKQHTLHFIQSGPQRRIYFSAGPEAPQCLIQRDSREFYCAQCDWISSDQCRSYSASEKAGSLHGTNIDQSDFEILLKGNYTSTCEDLPQQPQYFKVVSVRNNGTGPYNKIVSFYDKNRGVPITINFFSDNSLRKVYRFFPKQYFLVDGEWIATALRVRTVEGVEERFVFETLIQVLSQPDGSPQIFLDPKKDPKLQKSDYQRLFHQN